MGQMKNRGSILIAVLLTLSLLVILGMAFLSQRSAQYETQVQHRKATQALYLAQSGLSDFRTKCSRDPSFPPARSGDDKYYSYTELLEDSDGNSFGGYTVTVNTAKSVSHAPFLQVRSLGFLDRPDRPEASFEVYGELDFRKEIGSSPKFANPEYLKWTLYQEFNIPEFYNGP